MVNDFSEALKVSQKDSLDYLKKYCEANEKVKQLELENRKLKKQLKEGQK